MPTSTRASSSSPSSSRPVHPASLVSPANHSPALLQLLDIELAPCVIDYVVDCVAETVDYSLGRAHSYPESTYYKFTGLVSTVLARADVGPATVLTALVYVARARAHLVVPSEKWALERVFLGALIVASKYTQDSTLRNKHWARCTGVFSARDVGKIEREFLAVLDWELGVSEGELVDHHEGLFAALQGDAPAPLSAWGGRTLPSGTHDIHSSDESTDASFHTPRSKSRSSPASPPPSSPFPPEPRRHGALLAPPAPPPDHAPRITFAPSPLGPIGRPHALHAARLKDRAPSHKAGKLQAFLRALPHPTGPRGQHRDHHREQEGGARVVLA